MTFTRPKLSALVATALLAILNGRLPAQDEGLAPGPVEIAVSAEGAAVPGAQVRIGGRRATTDALGRALLDGLPQGDYEVEVLARGYDRQESRLQIPAGERAATEIRLTRSTNVTLRGRVATETDWPVAGAMIELSCARARNGWPARFSCASTWDGSFELLEVPVGRYLMSLRAAGCDPSSLELEVGEPATPLDLVMRRTTTSTDLEVTVRDAATGVAISGASLTLAEAWPKALIGTATTSGAGRATLSGLVLAQRNGSGGEDLLTATGGHATLRVEAAGYESRTISLPQRIGGAIAVALEPLDEIEEREPNADLATATPIRTGAPVVFRIAENGDRDHFRFRLDEPARITVRIAPEHVLWLRVHLLRADGGEIANTTADQGRELALHADLPRGDYVVLVHVYYDNATSDEAIRLRVERDCAADPFEPNDTPGAARLLRDGEEVSGRIFPIGDRDHFRFATSRDGQVRLTMPPCDLWRRIHVLDENGATLAETAADRGRPLELVRQLPAGRYVVQIRNYYDAQDSLEPYRLRLETIADDGIDDADPAADGAPRATRVMEIGESLGTTIFPAGDIDRFALAIPEPGLLRVRLTTPIWTRLFVRGRDGRLLAEASGSVGKPCEAACSLDAAEGLVVEVRQYYDNTDSASPFTLTSWFEPADEIDLLARDETLDDAFPVFVGEALRGTIHPVHDRDVYQLDIDHPGYLEISGESPVWTRLFVHDPTGELIGETSNGAAGRPLRLRIPVLPGEHRVMIRSYYDNEASTLPYVFATELARVAVDEDVPLAAERTRAIELGEVVPFAIEQNGDRDRFSFLVPSEGPFHLRLRGVVWTRWHLIDAAQGKQVAEGAVDRMTEKTWQLQASGPTRYRLELHSYYDNESSLDEGFFCVDLEDRPLTGCALAVTTNPCDPTAVVFALREVQGLPLPARALLDADGDGSDDLELAPGGTVAHRYPAAGVYAPRLRFMTPDGRKGSARGWAVAQGTRPRKGVQVVMNRPAEGALIEHAEPCRVRAVSWSGQPIRRVDFALDGRRFESVFSSPFETDPPYATLGPGEHVLRVTAIDGGGEEGVMERRFRVSEYFDLLPRDKAVVTGDDVVVSWSGPGFGRAALRFRPAGTESWSLVEGRRARERRIILDGLEAETSYEIQPVGDGEPGPIQTVMRVRGLAFGRNRYAAAIERDYDQRVGISIRNHADTPQRVRLACGAPPDESGLLVGFVGVGSAGDPIDLAPGEEREFMLVMSAQDALEPEVRFPIRLEAESGAVDEAEVCATIHLPEVKLVWEEQPPEENELCRSFILRNAGDGLTDLRLRALTDDILVEPELDHGVFPAGATMTVTVSPRLFEGFQHAEGQIEAGAITTTATQDVAIELPEGQSIHGIQLVAGAGIVDDEAGIDELRLAARSMSGAYLNPDSVDWSRRASPEDGDGDGRIDRWSIDDRDEGILWVGDDTTGDGEIDFVHADVGHDGQYDYSAYRTADGWQQTNLVEAYLEMGFALPQRREVYQKHDVDLIMNGVVVGRLRDVIPEGNYDFRLPPRAIRFDAAGNPSGNEVKIKSKHLNGGHYYLTSDFRIHVRMTGTRVWAVASSADQAKKKVLATEGLEIERPDYSISSAELVVSGTPTSGGELVFTVPIRNIGATRTQAVAVALVKDVGSGSEVELARSYVENVPLSGSTEARLAWTAVAGAHALRLVLDPDGETGDRNLANNRAATSVVVAGDQGPPTLAIVEPTDGATFTDTIVAVRVEAHDDDAVVRVELAVDGGLPAPMDALPEADTYAGRALLQPGRHRLTATVIDGSNQRTSQTIGVQVDAATPTVTITSPAEGASIDAPQVALKITTSADARVVAGRVNGGPWRRAESRGGEVDLALDLEFGDATIEVMATNDRGARATARLKVRGTVQAEEEDLENEPEKEPEVDPGERERADSTIDVAGVGPVDALGPPNLPLPATGAAQPEGSDRDETAQAATAATPGGALPAGVEPERSRVGAAPATDLQPGGLPPVRQLPEPPADDEDEGETVEDVVPPEDEAPLDGDADPPVELEAGEVLGGPPSRAGVLTGRAGNRPAGGFIGAQARRKDWYCTNRPEIKVKFRLPDWLKNKELPKPGTKEFDAMITRLLTDMRMRGFKMDRIEQFQKSLLKRIRGLNQPGELPGFLESFNIGGPAPEDPKALAAWRAEMEKRAQAWYLRLLASGDPALVAQGLKARAEAIGQFDQAMLEHAEGAIKEIEGNQKLVEDVAEALPVVGEMSDVYAFITGETALTGSQVSALERVIRLVGVVGPFGLEQLVKRSPNARLVLQGIGEMGTTAGAKGRQMLAAVLNLPPGKVDDTLEAIGKFLTKERRLIGETMEDKMAREARLFAKSPQGIADSTRMLKDHAEARDLINRMRQAAPDSDDFKAALRELQSNKTAQALINRADVPDSLRKEVNGQIKNWYKQADDGVAGGFESLYRNGKPSADDTARIANELGITPKQAQEFQDQVEDFARRHGIDPSEVKVDKLTITNKRPPKPGEVPKTSVGRDRDVTFQLQAPARDPKTGAILRDADGNVRFIGEDIDHAVSKNVYDRNFYTASGKGDLPRLKDGTIDQKAISTYAEETMDQMVTSRWHPEAYNTGPVQLDDFLDKSVTPTLTRIDDVSDTVAYKSDHWFKKADDVLDPASEAAQGLSETQRAIMASRHSAEGMRQATKQYDDLILSRVRQYGLDPSKAVPPRLEKSMEIFRKVKDGAISPAKAEAMLKAIGTSKEGAVREMAGFLNGLEKTTGVGWRRVKSAELVNHIADLKKAGSGWQEGALEAVNGALKRGEISGPQFLKLRQDVSAGVVQRMKTEYPGQWQKKLAEWADQAFERRLINGAERAAFQDRGE